MTSRWKGKVQVSVELVSHWRGSRVTVTKAQQASHKYRVSVGSQAVASMERGTIPRLVAGEHEIISRGDSGEGWSTMPFQCW